MIQDYFSNSEPFTNSLSGKSKDEIILEFAYSLATCNKSSRKNSTKEELLKMWRFAGADIDVSFPAKLIRKYRSRYLSADDTLERIALILKDALNHEDFLCGTAFSAFVGMSFYILDEASGESFGMKGNVRTEGDSELSSLMGLKTEINWTKFRTEWGSAIAYIRTFLTRDKLMTYLEDRDAPLQDSFITLIDMIFSDDGLGWFIDRSQCKEDKAIINRYSNDSGYYKLCIDRAYDRLSYMQDKFLFATSTPAFGAYKGYALSGLWNDSSGMRAGYSKMLKREMETSPLAMDKSEEELIPPPEETYLDFFFAKAALKYIFEFSRRDIDILSVCRFADLPKKEALLIVKEAFLLHEVWLGEDCKFTSKKDKESVSEIIVRLWMERSLDKRFAALVHSKKAEGVTVSASEYKKIAEELKKDVASLEKRLTSSEKRAEGLASKNASASRDARSEISSLKDELEAKERLLKAKDDEKEDLLKLFMLSGDEAVVEESTEPSLCEDDFRNYINAHKVLVWGLREDTEKKYKAMFPELSFISSDRRLTRQQLSSYEVLIMATNYCSHGTFWTARDTAKASGIPMAYLEKTANSPVSLYRALDIAIGQGAEDLHSK